MVEHEGLLETGLLRCLPRERNAVLRMHRAQAVGVVPCPDGELCDVSGTGLANRKAGPLAGAAVRETVDQDRLDP